MPPNPPSIRIGACILRPSRLHRGKSTVAVEFFARIVRPVGKTSIDGFDRGPTWRPKLLVHKAILCCKVTGLTVSRHGLRFVQSRRRRPRLRLLVHWTGALLRRCCWDGSPDPSRLGWGARAKDTST
jgi:hypothetical protein